MSSIEFNQDKNYKRIENNSNNSSFVNFLVKKGIAKDAKSANLVLLGISGASLVLMSAVFYFFVFGGSLPSFGSNNTPSNNNANIIQGYRDQGLKGPELMKKIQEARASGLIK